MANGGFVSGRRKAVLEREEVFEIPSRRWTCCSNTACGPRPPAEANVAADRFSLIYGSGGQHEVQYLRVDDPGNAQQSFSDHSVYITVILCTFNRCQSLAKALESVAAQTLPHTLVWEVLVVDNNSRDQTRTVVEDFCLKYPSRFRYLFEPQPGKSYALNAGIREARGGILAFIDDDVTAEPTWLQNLTAELRSGEWAGAGGPILPERGFSPPPWLSGGDLRSFAPLALFNLGPQPGALTEPPFGTNMAFRKEIFERYGGFRTDLGPQPDSILRGEDTEFGSRILAAGLQLRYAPSAKVFHAVPENRLQKKYFLAWWFDKGRSDVREFGIPPEVRWFVGGIPLYLFRRITMWTLRWTAAVRPARRFYCQTRLRWLAGQIVESRRRETSRPDGKVKVA
jgi:glucosyl-dolichyl phosphate glucuronosyltransferase